jgi:hypothetical protein
MGSRRFGIYTGLILGYDMQREQLIGKLGRLQNELRLRAGINARYTSRVLDEIDATRAELDSAGTGARSNIRHPSGASTLQESACPRYRSAITARPSMGG